MQLHLKLFWKETKYDQLEKMVFEMFSCTKKKKKNVKNYVNLYLRLDEERSKDTLLEMLKVSTVSRDLTGKYNGLEREEKLLVRHKCS